MIISNTNPVTQVASEHILLTFDDGPIPGLTLQILDILREFEVHACFFVYGQRGAEHPELLRSIAAEGHELGNHTWSHPRLLETSDAEIYQEIYKTQALIEDATGQTARFFRPPYGKIRARTVKMIQEEFNMDTMLWSLDPEDWSSPGAAVIHARVSQAVRGGDIVLLHERSQTVEALPAMLSSLCALNMDMGKVSISTKNALIE